MNTSEYNLNDGKKKTMCTFFTEELPHLLAVLLPRIDPAGSHWKQLPARQKQVQIPVFP